MDRDYLINLTLAIHQAGEEWPESNLLKFRVRSLANKILADFILMPHENPAGEIGTQIEENIQFLKQALKEVRAQKLITRREFLLFQKEYSKMGEVVKKELFKTTVSLGTIKTQEKQTKPRLEGLNQRQKKILDILQKKRKAQVWELKESFAGVSKRTLRRDLENLLKKALVQRSGKWNKVFYTLSKLDRTG